MISRRTCQHPGPTVRVQLHRPLGWVLLAILFAASPAHAVRISDFGVACYDGSARISFIELSGNPLEHFDHTIGIRTLDRSGSVLWEAPDIYVGLKFVTFWIPDPPRRIGIVTQETVDRLGMPTPPDLLMGSPMDTLAGSIILFRGATVLERIDYGEGRAVQAPPPGTSMLFGPTGWAIQRSPVVQQFSYLSGFPYGSDHGGCLGAPSWAVSGLLTRCDDGSTGGQYIQLVARGDGAIDSSVRVLVLDHAGQQLADFTPFQRLVGSSFLNGVNWLIAGPSFGSGSGQHPPDFPLPVVLDPLGGTVEVGGTFGGVSWTQDVFVYGTADVPAPAPGYAYARVAGQAPALALPAPRDFSGVVQVPPDCAFGSHPSSLFIRELSLACASGSMAGQFVEVGVLGGDFTLDETYELRALDRSGTLLFSAPGIFGSLAGRIVPRSGAVLISGTGVRSRPGSDVPMPAFLDTTAGTVVLSRNLGGVSSVIATLPYGDAQHPRPPNGTSLESDAGLVYHLQSYPTPSGMLGPAPLEDCEYRDGPPSAVVRQIGITCSDGSDSGLFFELFAAGGTHSEDSNLGLAVVAGSEPAPVTVYPLFPPGSAPMPAGGHRLWATTGFASRTGYAPDALLPGLAGPPREVEVFRRDPITGLDRALEGSDLPIGSLSPGHGFLRDASGHFDEIVGPRPVRGDDLTIVGTDCYPEPRSDAVRIRALFLRCRDGGEDAQFVELESTSPDAVTSPGLSLRAYDSSDARLFDVAVPAVWPVGTEARWPEGIVVLAGGVTFRDRMGISPDLTLPAKLDSLGGRLELVLRDGADEHVVSAIAYGAHGVPPPPSGAALVWTADGFVAKDQPIPTNSNGESGRSQCLGVCEDRKLIVGGQDRYLGSDPIVERTFEGANAGYDAPRGTFQLRSGNASAAAQLPDRFRVVGIPMGAPVTVQMGVQLAASVNRMCFDSGCAIPTASLRVTTNNLVDSTAFTGAAFRELDWSCSVLAGEDFGVELSPAVLPGSLAGETAAIMGRLEVSGLPPGARLVSCLGFDSDRTRPAAAGTITAGTDGVRISWRVDPQAVSSAALERSLDPDKWLAVATKTPGADGLLEFVDSDVLPGRTYTYRLFWTDAFGPNVTPSVTITLDQTPALSLDRVYPNPSTGALSARVRIPEAGEVRLEALDVAGRVVASQTAWREAGVHELPISRDRSLAPGVYVIRLHYRGSIMRTTAIVLR